MVAPGTPPSYGVSACIAIGKETEVDPDEMLRLFEAHREAEAARDVDAAFSSKSQRRRLEKPIACERLAAAARR
jgi:hypothetical protein